MKAAAMVARRGLPPQALSFYDDGIHDRDPPKLNLIGRMDAYSLHNMVSCAYYVLLAGCHHDRFGIPKSSSNIRRSYKL